MYEVVFQINIKNFLKKLPKKDAANILETIESLTVDPRPRWVEKLQGRSGYRTRVGNYRIIYSVDDGKLIIFIIDVDHRKDVYK
jgi:mRNA interferase RelE/StbE